MNSACTTASQVIEEVHDGLRLRSLKDKANSPHVAVLCDLYVNREKTTVLRIGKGKIGREVLRK